MCIWGTYQHNIFKIIICFALYKSNINEAGWKNLDGSSPRQYKNRKNSASDYTCYPKFNYTYTKNTRKIRTLLTKTASGETQQYKHESQLHTDGYLWCISYIFKRTCLQFARCCSIAEMRTVARMRNQYWTYAIIVLRRWNSQSCDSFART